MVVRACTTRVGLAALTPPRTVARKSDAWRIRVWAGSTRLVRRTARRDPCGDARPGWHARRGCSSGHGSRGCGNGGGCSAGKCACSRGLLPLSSKVEPGRINHVRPGAGKSSPTSGDLSTIRAGAVSCQTSRRGGPVEIELHPCSPVDTPYGPKQIPASACLAIPVNVSSTLSTHRVFHRSACGETDPAGLYPQAVENFVDGVVDQRFPGHGSQGRLESPRGAAVPVKG